jgi:hypothetical protein
MNPFLVYSMGKVGTSTVVHSLHEQMPRSPVYHVHTLSRQRIKSEEKVYRTNFRELGTIHDHLLDSIYVNRQLASQRHDQKRWRIVTLVREPIQRNISAFFQTLNLHGKGLGFAKRIDHGQDENLIGDMLHYFVTMLDHSRPFEWFDVELKEHFGIDVLGAGFPKEKGYEIFRGEYADALVIRLEDLNRCAADAFHEFAGIENFRLEKKQDSGKKYYAATYKEFLQQAKFPKAFLNKMYDSEYARTFYSECEIDAFREKWGPNS